MSNTESDWIYIPEMARKLGTTEAGLRSALQRARLDLAKYVPGKFPPWTYVLNRPAWDRDVYRRWKEDRSALTAAAPEPEKRRPGRPRGSGRATLGRSASARS